MRFSGEGNLMKRDCFSCLSIVVLIAVLLLLTAIPTAKAQSLPLCSWPFEVTGRGLTNVATPDTNATYWVMPLDTRRWKTVIIDGEYPEARFFNYTVYESDGTLVDSRVDSSISPNPGSENPFAVRVDPRSHKNTYTVHISRNAGGSDLHLGQSRLEFLVYRVYAPDKTFDRTGGADVPEVTLESFDGGTRKLRSCPFADAESSLANLIILLRVNGFTDAANFLQGVLMTANQLRFGPGSCPSGQPAPAVVGFEVATLGADFFPNRETTYLETSGFCFQPNKALVVKGRAPVFPDTYNFGSIFDPAPPFPEDSVIQARYWSMCNNDRKLPYPVVACQPDFATKIVPDQHNPAIYTYTYVVSADPAPPAWLPDNATWLPWGAIDIPKNLIFRIILPQDTSTLPRDYYPQGKFCEAPTACVAMIQAGM
jgi:hypothetical protein